jgi:hypothetical protein
MMRLTLVVAALSIAGALAVNTSAHAQFNEKYCSIGGDDESSGDLDCSFYTIGQCREAARGIGRTCMENPRLQWERMRGKSSPARKAPGRQRRRDND